MREYRATAKGKEYKRKERNRPRNKKAQSVRQKANAAWIRKVAQGRGCAMCGTTIKLHWHHFHPHLKTSPVMAMTSCSRERIQQEMDKCVVLCQPHHTGPDGIHSMMDPIKRKKSA